MKIIFTLLVAFVAVLGLQQSLVESAADADHAFSVDTAGGSWRVGCAGQTLSGLVMSLDGTNLLKDAVVQQKGDKLIAEKNVDGLLFHAEWSVVAGQWIQVRASLKNTTANVREIRSFEFLRGPYAGALTGQDADQFRFYQFTREMPDHQECGIFEIGDKQIESSYLGVLFAANNPHAWIIGYRPPQLWNSAIFVDGANKGLAAAVDLSNTPFPIDPQEEIRFDPLLLSADFNLTEGLQAFGRLYPGRQKSWKAPELTGYNTWEFYHLNISAANQDSVLSSLRDWKPSDDFIHYHILDEGWSRTRGDWTFNPVRFPQGAEGWVKTVNGFGLQPGVWIAPFLASPQAQKQQGFDHILPEEGRRARAALDPSDPKVIATVCSQVNALSGAGVRYFKTDFLYCAYRPHGSYQFSKWPAERVQREFYEKMRQAMGPDPFWLACGTTFASCPGLVDGARIAGDVKANWQYLRQAVAPRIASLFWMQGNVWINDPDFLIVKGPNTLKPGAKPFFEQQTVSSFVDYQGLTLDEATTWAAEIVASGGLVTWSDTFETTPEAAHIVAAVLEHGGGQGGIPLDLETSSPASKWVRRDGDRTYVALLNWSDQTRQLSVSSHEIPELGEFKEGNDIFSDQTVAVNEGSVAVSLRPHASVCLLMKR